jgi:hypothetical protein
MGYMKGTSHDFGSAHLNSGNGTRSDSIRCSGRLFKVLDVVESSNVKFYLSLIVVLALVGCASTVPPREQVAPAPQVFQINPVRPVAELLPIALAASPPVEQSESARPIWSS